MPPCLLGVLYPSLHQHHCLVGHASSIITSITPYMHRFFSVTMRTQRCCTPNQKKNALGAGGKGRPVQNSNQNGCDQQVIRCIIVGVGEGAGVASGVL